MASASASFARQSATYLENWPPALASLSMPHLPLPLAAEERDASSAGFRPCRSAGTRVLEGLRGRLADALSNRFPTGAFLRLGSRSPKDLLAVASSSRAHTAEQAMLALERSRRVREDCTLARAHGYLPTLFLREWRAIPAGAEFRGFLRDHQLVGFCPYHARSGPHPLPVGLDFPTAERRLRAFFPRVVRACPVDPVVDDAYLHPTRMCRTAGRLP